nr:hypothetical protein [Candidatus Sigynarchaeota archaeon]
MRTEPTEHPETPAGKGEPGTPRLSPSYLSDYEDSGGYCIYGIGCILIFFGMLTGVMIVVLASASTVTALVTSWGVTGAGFTFSLYACTRIGKNIDPSRLDQAITTKLRNGRLISFGFIVMMLCGESIITVVAGFQLGGGTLDSPIMHAIPILGGVFIFTALFGFGFSTLWLLDWAKKARIQ